MVFLKREEKSYKLFAAIRSELGKEYIFLTNGNRTDRHLTPIDNECARDTH